MLFSLYIVYDTHMLLKRLHVDDWVYVAVDSAHEVVLTGLFSQVGVREPLPRVQIGRAHV